MSSLAPSPRILEYCRQLSCSDGPFKTLNLRHLGDLSASDLTFLPPHINSMWIGPGFRSPTTDVVQNLPKGLQQLDLDLTATTSELNAHDEQILIGLLFERAVALESLSLRVQGCAGVSAVAWNLRKATSLTMLDFRSNHMGDKGIEVLCKAILASEKEQGFSSIQHLILSWNNITDAGVLALCQVLQSPQCSLKHLDLSCNKRISDAGFSAICESLRYNKSLERLTLFCCPRITNASLLKDLLIEDVAKDMAAASGTKVYNYTLQYVDLGATAARAKSEIMKQIKFGLSLNRAGRLQLRCQKDHFYWILKSNLEDDAMVDADSSSSQVQWWRPAHELVFQENPLEDLSISFYLLRQTSAFWSKPTQYTDGETMACD